MSTVRKLIQKINIYGKILKNEPMSKHTSFRIGGPAEVYFAPDDDRGVRAAVVACRENDIPLFVLGGGANIVVSDSGIRGMVMDMQKLDAVVTEGEDITAEAGAEISRVSETAAGNGLTGMEFIYAMPGSVGGSVWMNARCYGVSISSVLGTVDYVDENGETVQIEPNEEEFGYKKSPFQNRGGVVLSVTFRLKPASDPDSVWRVMEGNKRDRESKGHFTLPCAGSVFKNNRAFGEPTGKLVDSLGLRGHQIGGAKVSDSHANIIVNTGNATAADVSALVEYIEARVKAEYGYELEREIIFI